MRADVVDPDENRSREELLAELRALRAEHATWLLREPIAAVLRGLTDAITLIDADGRIVYANEAAAAQVGAPDIAALLASSPTNLQGRLVLLDHDGREISIERLPTRRALRGETVRDEPVRYRSAAGGSERWAQVSAIPVFDAAGAVTHVVRLFRDITDRRDAERALEAQLRLTQTITDNATAALILTDARQRCTYMNPAAVALLGYSVAEVQGRPLRELLGAGPLLAALQAPEPRRGEDSIQRKGGAAVQVGFTSSPVVGDGRPLGVVLELRDIGAELRARDELRLRARVLESMTEGVRVADERGFILYTNPAEDAMFGDPPGARVGHHVGEPGERKAHDGGFGGAALERVQERGAWVGELHHVRSDGTPFVTQARLTTLDLSGRRHLLRVQEDITQERRDREALRFLAEANAALMASLDHARTLQDLTRLAVPRLGTWCCVYLREDDGALELAAVSHVDPARTQLIRDLYARGTPDPRAPLGPEHVLRTGESMLSELDDDALVRSARGPDELELLRQLAPRSWMLVPLKVQRRTYGLISVVNAEGARRHDAADLALLEEVARRASVAVDNARLFDMAQKERARAEEANRAKDLFLSTLSHELRTPLTAILGWTRMLRSSSLAPERREKGLETIERNARAQVALIEDILDLSRIVTGKLRLDLQAVDLAAVVDAAVETVRPAVDARSIRLQVAIDPGAGVVIGDPNRLQQVVWNLLTNAVKFTPRGGRVQVVVLREGSHVEITVADNGEGIDPALLPHVFDRFRQGDASTTRNHGGLGLGLAIVKHLVELHGGTISAASAGEGRGASFTARIPVAPLRSSALAASEPRPEIEGIDCPPELAGLRVLIVDDEDDARDWVRALLEHCEARVSAASSVAEALELLRSVRPDVLISDIGMPGEDGYSLIKKIRLLPPGEGGRTPAIALTAYARMEDRTRAMVAGFNMHVAKPIDPAELLITIANLAGRLG